MTTLLTEVLDAFRAINVPEDKARAAAVALSQADDKFAKLDTRLAELEGRMNTRFAGIVGRLDKLQWMLAFLLAANVAILVKLFWPHSG